MKIIFLICNLLVFTSINTIYSQNAGNIAASKKQYGYIDTLPIYFKINGGYALPLASANLNSFTAIGSYYSTNQQGFTDITYIFTPPSSEITYKGIDVSLGKGINMSAAIGFDFKKNFSLEVGANYLQGSKFTAHEINKGIENNMWHEGEHKRELFSRLLAAEFALILRGKAKKATPYMKIGGLFAIPTIYYHEKVYGMPFCNPMYSQLDWKYYGGHAVGAIAAGGIYYKLNKEIEIFAEVKITALSYAPLKGKMTSYLVNGVNKVDTLPVNETNVVFLNSTTWDTVTPSITSPTKQLKYHFPFSSLGVNIGVKFNLGKTYYRKKKIAVE